MTRTFLLLLAASLAGASAIHAQTANPVIADAKASYNSIKGYLTRAAAAMPAENYSFKPTPDVRSFGALMAHIADHQVRFCSQARGAAKKGNPDLTGKAELVEALAASFKECDAAWDSITDANASETVGQRSRLGTLLVDVIHSNEEYGYMSVYFRLKGIVPPSSDRTGGK
jgi:hypothetical protein